MQGDTPPDECDAIQSDNSISWWIWNISEHAELLHVMHYTCTSLPLKHSWDRDTPGIHLCLMI